MKRYFVDTNVICRFLVHDNAEQYTLAHAIFQKAVEGKAKIFTSTIVFFEVKWVLNSVYTFDKHKLIETLKLLLSFEALEMQERKVLQKALELFAEANIELEDCYNLISALSDGNGCDEFYTFDKKLKKLASVIKET